MLDEWDVALVLQQGEIKSNGQVGEFQGLEKKRAQESKSLVVFSFSLLSTQKSATPCRETHPGSEKGGLAG